MIPGAKSCRSVGKLGDRVDPEGATASKWRRSNGEGTQRRSRWTGGREDTRRGREKKREYKVVPPGEKTAVVFPNEVEEEDKRGRSQKTDTEGWWGLIRR